MPMLIFSDDNISYKIEVWLDGEGLGLAKEMEGSIPSHEINFYDYSCIGHLCHM